MIDLIRNRARTLIYSTGLPPSCVAASIAALDLIEREPAYAALPVQKAKAFTRRANLPEAQSPIVPVIIGAEAATLAASQLLADEGYLAAAIRPPTVPAGTARLRLTFTAQHPDEHIERLADIVRDKTHSAQTNERLFRHRDRHRYRQDLRHRRADPAICAAWASRSTRSSRW